MNEELLKMIEDTAAYAKATGCANAQIVLYALRGALSGGHDYLLATQVRNFTKEVLIPLTLKERDDEIDRIAKLN